MTPVVNYIYECSNRNWNNVGLVLKVIDLNKMCEELRITDIEQLVDGVKVCVNIFNYLGAVKKYRMHLN